MTDKDGNPFYYSASTQQSVWAQPSDWIERGAWTKQ